MKAAVIKGKDELVIEDVPEPSPKSEEVVLKVSYCGVCGTDIRYFSANMVPPGTIMGHEFSGVVVDVGADVQGWRIGERAVVYPLVTCGECVWCLRGRKNLCPKIIESSYGFGRPGAYAEYVTAIPSTLFHVPEEIGDKEAATVEPLAVGFHGVRISKIRLGDPIVILGAGPIGLMTLLCAKLAGPGRIYVSSPNRIRGDIAKKIGADRVLNTKEENILIEITKLTGWGPEIYRQHTKI